MSSSDAEVKAPVKVHEARGWYVANYTDDDDIQVSVDSIRENVRIQNCNHCTVKIDGKTAAIIVDRCEKLRLEFDSVISSVEVFNGKQIDMRPRSSLPSVRIEKTESIVIYLNQVSIGCKIIHHLSYPVVIMIPRTITEASAESGASSIYNVVTLPCLFESQLKGTTFVTKPCDYC